MDKTTAVSIAVAALLIATPALGQRFHVPVLPLPVADGELSIAGGIAGGMDDNSGKLDAFGGSIAYAMERFSFGMGWAYVRDVPQADSTKSEFTLAPVVAAYHLPILDDSPVTVSIQSGIGWMSVASAVPNDNTTLLNIPIGVSVQGSTTAGSLQIPLWVMPRVQFTRSSTGGASSTETDFGASAGVLVVWKSGIGIGMTIDWLRTDDGTGTGTDSSEWLFGLGMSHRFH